MATLIGRDKEKQQLADALTSNEAELVAVYGRRRVGKTFLIREFYQDNLAFEFTGQQGATLATQLQNLSTKLSETFNVAFVGPITSWTEAFTRLKTCLAPLLSHRESVIFFDEFPWIDAPKSGFLSAFDYFWNDWASKQANLKVVICGSAASWMIRKVIQNRGGLHNRVTRQIRLLPFTLQETELFLKARNITLDRYQIIQLYMAFGGIPHYLKEIRRGQSTGQLINELCFHTSGLLYGEFENLYRSLFQNYTVHTQIVRQLAQKADGLTRNEMIAKTGISSGGTTTQILDELTNSGFVSAYVPFGKSQKDLVYKLTDEYSLFYLKFMEKGKFRGEDVWNQLSHSASYKSWCGLAFEMVCLKHVHNIKKALGIAGIYTELSVWRHRGDASRKGAQIDLLIDRKDNSINICEMKFTEQPFVITNAYADEIQNKLSVFRQTTSTRKTLFFTAISTYGFQENAYKHRWIDKELLMDSLFD